MEARRWRVPLPASLCLADAARPDLGFTEPRPTSGVVLQHQVARTFPAQPLQVSVFVLACLSNATEAQTPRFSPPVHACSE